MAETPNRTEAESPSPPSSEPAEPDDSAQIRRRLRRRLIRPLVTLVVVALAVWGARFYRHALAWESTDDAFVGGDIYLVSPRVAGQIATVDVDDNQWVKKGQLLVGLDSAAYATRVAEAKAALASSQAHSEAAQAQLTLIRATTAAKLQEAQSQVAIARAAVADANAQVVVASSEAQRAEADERRYGQVRQSGAVSEQQFEHARFGAMAAGASLQAARQKVNEAEASLEAAQARLASAKADLHQVPLAEAQARTAASDAKQAQAELERTELDLSYTAIPAPVDGYVTKKAVDVGQYVQPGQSLLAVVPTTAWVDANFKETQLTRMRPGQSVLIHMDTYPGVTFHGHVESIQRGTGAAFSLLPPENASGNYVKVVQRLPVKIVFDELPDPRRYILARGMSVVPEVHVSESPGTALTGVTDKKPLSPPNSP